ncbi:MAG TPA: D-alanine--D-alanine ligase [Polyangia bacterium]
MKGKRIGVVMGGPSSEREVSLNTGRGVHAALAGLGYDAVALDWTGDLAAQLREARVEVVWNALHGTFGEDGCVQGLCEVLGLPYTGSGVMASAVAMDKILSKRLFTAAGLQVPEWRSVRTAADCAPVGLPCVIKPSREGSSVGVTIVRRAEDLDAAIAAAARLHGEVLCERYVKAREIQIGILDEAPLGTVEVRPAVEFYDYAAKYQRKDTQYLCPAPLAPALEGEMRALGLTAHQALGCATYSRVDFLVTETGEAFILEVNTLPGMTATSLIPKMAAHAGLSYAALCERILAGARLKA